MLIPGAPIIWEDYYRAVEKAQSDARAWAEDKSVDFAVGYLSDRSWWQKRIVARTSYRRRALIEKFPHLEKL